MMKKSKLLLIVSMLTLIVFITSACAKAGEGNSSGSGNSKELVIAVPEEIESTDIQQVKWNNIVHELLFEPLVSYDLELKNLVASGSTSYEVSADGTEITFKLDKDAKFSNGDPLTAEVIKKSMDRYVQISPYSSDFDPVQEFIAKDPQTFVIKLKGPAAYLWPVLASSYGAVVDVEKANAQSKEDFGLKAIGNGLFSVEEWTQGSQITLAKNQNYKTANSVATNKGPSSFDKVTVKFIAEDFTRISELESGSVDIAFNVPSESVESLKGNKDVKLYEYLQTGVNYIALNTQKAPFNDVKVRNAIALAINKDQIATTLKNTVIPKYGWVSPAQLCFDEATENKLKGEFGYSTEKAKALLAEAGWKDGNGDGILEKDGKPLGFTFMVSLDNPYLKQSAPVIQSQLKEIGVNVELREYESPYIKKAVADKNFDMATRMFRWSDPDILTYQFGSASTYPWSNKEVSALLEKARFTMDMKERTKVYAEAQEKIMTEVPAIPLFTEYQYIAVKKTVEGVKVGADGRVYLHDAVKK